MPRSGQRLQYSPFKRKVAICRSFSVEISVQKTKIDRAIGQLQPLMTGKCCICHGNSQSKGNNASFHQFLSDMCRQTTWLWVFELQESDLKLHHVCCRNVSNGDAKSDPILTVGKRFASPVKKGPQVKS